VQGASGAQRQQAPQPRLAAREQLVEGIAVAAAGAVDQVPALAWIHGKVR
jgi:hypothetical protein